MGKPIPLTMTVRLLVVQKTSCSSGTYCNNRSWYFEESVPLLFCELTYSVMFSPGANSGVKIHMTLHKSHDVTDHVTKPD